MLSSLGGMTTTRTAPEDEGPRTAKAQFDRWAKRHGLEHNSDALIRVAEIDDEIDAYATNRLLATAQAEQVSAWLMRHGDDGRRLVTIQASIEKDRVNAHAENAAQASR